MNVDDLQLNCRHTLTGNWIRFAMKFHSIKVRSHNTELAQVKVTHRLKIPLLTGYSGNTDLYRRDFISVIYLGS